MPGEILAHAERNRKPGFLWHTEEEGIKELKKVVMLSQIVS